MISLLLVYGANVEARDKEGNSVLLHYAQHNNLQGVHLLLNYGCDIQAVNFRADTALSYALHERLWAIVDMLLKRGYDPLVGTVLMYARDLSDDGEKAEALERLLARNSEMSVSQAMVLEKIIFSDILCEIDVEFDNETQSEYKDFHKQSSQRIVDRLASYIVAILQFPKNLNNFHYLSNTKNKYGYSFPLWKKLRFDGIPYINTYQPVEKNHSGTYLRMIFRNDKTET